MRWKRDAAVALALASVVTGCSSDDGSAPFGPDGGGCVSHYEDIVKAGSRAELDRELVADVDAAVVRLRVQGRGAASGENRREAEFVDLLSRRGRRVLQVEVFQLADGEWFGGQWLQCTD